MLWVFAYFLSHLLTWLQHANSRICSSPLLIFRFNVCASLGGLCMLSSKYIRRAETSMFLKHRLVFISMFFVDIDVLYRYFSFCYQKQLPKIKQGTSLICHRPMGLLLTRIFTEAYFFTPNTRLC